MRSILSTSAAVAKVDIIAIVGIVKLDERECRQSARVDNGVPVFSHDDLDEKFKELHFALEYDGTSLHLKRC